MPATAEHRASTARGTEEDREDEARIVAEATHCFIGVMDTVKLDMRAKDQVAPMVGDLLLALCKLGRLPADFEGTRSRARWRRGVRRTTGAKARCAVRRRDAKRWRETRGCDGARVRSPMDGSMDGSMDSRAWATRMTEDLMTDARS